MEFTKVVCRSLVLIVHRKVGLAKSAAGEPLQWRTEGVGLDGNGVGEFNNP